MNSITEAINSLNQIIIFLLNSDSKNAEQSDLLLIENLKEKLIFNSKIEAI